MTQSILISLPVLAERQFASGEYDGSREWKERPNRFMKNFIEAISEHFDVYIYSTSYRESERYQINQWLVDHGFAVDELLLRSDGDYSRATETIFTMIEEQFKSPEKDIAAFIECGPTIVECLRDNGFEVLEAG